MRTYARTINLTAAQLIAMGTTAIEVVPTPGAGKALVARGFVFKYTGGTAFTGGGAIAVYQGATVQSGTLTAATLVANGATSSINKVADASAAIVANTALSISNATAAFAAGTGTASVTVFFQIVNV